MKIKLTLAAFAISMMAMPTVTPTPAMAGKWVACGAEGSRCSWSGGGVRRVRYGVSGLYRYRRARSGIICANANFGDPAKFRRKSCWSYVPTTVYRFCAHEGNRCNFRGVKTVRYGASGRYRFKKFRNGVICANANFGDPIKFRRKRCSIQSFE